MELLTGTDLWPVAIFTVIFILLVDLLHRRQRWTSRCPPGPVPWPVLGNLLQVDLDNMPYSLYKVSDLVVYLYCANSVCSVHSEGQATGPTAIWNL